MCEIPQVASTREVKARKPHKCCDCREEIKKGDQYQYTKGIWAGEPHSFKHCLNCAYIYHNAVILDSEDGGDGVGFTELREWFFCYMCRDFKGQEFLDYFAKRLDMTSYNLNRLLKIPGDEL